MRLALGVLIASAVASLSIVEARIAVVMDDSFLVEIVEGDILILKGLLAAVGAFLSLWGIALGSRKFRGPQERRVAIIVSGAGIAGVTLILWKIEFTLAAGLAAFALLALFLGLAAFAASNTIYNDVDFREWRRALAGYYIASALGSSMLTLAHVEGLATIILPPVSLVSALIASSYAGSSIIPNTSLKVIENFASAAMIPRSYRRFRLHEVVRASSLIGSLSAVKLALLSTLPIAGMESAPLLFNVSYSMGVALSVLEASLTMASLLSLASLVAIAVVDAPEVSLALVGLSLGYVALTTVDYVLDTAPRRLRIVSVQIFLWTAVSSIIVSLLAYYAATDPALPAIAVALSGFLIAEKVRARGLQWS